VSWLGLLIAFAGVAGYFVMVGTIGNFQIVPWAFLAVMAVGVVLAVGGFVRAPRVGAGIALGLAVAVTGFANWYLFSYSIFAGRETRPAVGDVLPSFGPLPTSVGGTFRLEDARGRYLLLLFYRGAW